MSQRALYVVVAILAIAVIVFGIAWYNEVNKPKGLNVEFGNGSMSINENGVKVETK